MNRWFPRLLVLALLVQFIIYAVRPMISYEAIALGADTLAIGIVSASFAALALVLTVPIGRQIDHRGELPFLVVGSMLITAVPLLVLLTSSVPALAVCNALLGVGQILSVVASQTLIAKGSQLYRREARFGAFAVTTSLGQLLGPAVAGLLVGDATDIASARSVPNAALVFGISAAIGVASLVCAASLLLVPHTLARRPSASTGGGRPPRGTVRRVLSVPGMPFAMLASLTVLATIDILSAYLPLYGESRGLSVRDVGFLLATNGIAMMVSRVFMVLLIRRFGRRRVLVSSMVVPAAAVAGLPFMAAGPALYVLMAIIGLGLGLGQPITLGWVASRSPREIRGTAVGIRLTGNRLGQTIIPVTVGGLAGATSLLAVFLSPAALLCLSSLFVLRSQIDPAEPEG